MPRGHPYYQRINLKQTLNKCRGTLEEAQGALWFAIEETVNILVGVREEAARHGQPQQQQLFLSAEKPEPEKPSNEMILKCTHALSQACQAYVRMLEVGEFEARIKALEAIQEQVPTLHLN